MSFTVQQVKDRMKNIGIDAEGSDFYTDTRDYIPAINSALTWVKSLVESAYAENKVSEEIFRELTYVDVFETNHLSRISIPSYYWTILAVIPKPKVVNDDGSFTITVPLATHTDIFQSVQRTDLVYIDSPFGSAQRLTVEQWENNAFNPLEPGNVILTDANLVQYGYLNMNSYRYAYSDQDIEIRPDIVVGLCAIRHVRYHGTLTSISDTILFPVKLFDMLTDKSLQYITRKQADGTTIDGVTDRDISRLSQMFKIIG